MGVLPKYLREYCYSLGITKGVQLQAAVAARPNDVLLHKAYAMWVDALGQLAMRYGM